MKVIEFPKQQPELDERAHVQKFLEDFMKLIADKKYDPVALMVVMVEESSMVPIAVNLTGHEAISYLEVAKSFVIDKMRTPS